MDLALDILKTYQETDNPGMKLELLKLMQRMTEDMKQDLAFTGRRQVESKHNYLQVSGRGQRGINAGDEVYDILVTKRKLKLTPFEKESGICEVIDSATMDIDSVTKDISEHVSSHECGWSAKVSGRNKTTGNIQISLVGVF